MNSFNPLRIPHPQTCAIHHSREHCLDCDCGAHALVGLLESDPTISGVTLPALQIHLMLSYWNTLEASNAST